MLITTKLCIPPLKGKMLYRKHLADRLSLGRDCRLISISGPAASGKTSLVCEWIKRNGLPVAWYSLDEADNDHATFFQYLTAALSRTGHISLSDIACSSESQDNSSTRDIISHIVSRLNGLKKDFYLVLDDYHLISTQEIHNALSLLITNMPPPMHVVILSRHEVPFPLSRWKVKNDMLEICSQDMRWSAKETDRFFRELLGIRLSSGQSEQLTRHMEGWVGGLRLFALSLKGKRTMAGMAALLGKAGHDAADYLINEVINTQPDEVRLFLLKTALLGRFNAELCNEVTGGKDAAALLSYVFQNNLFLNPLDDEETWFRYHHLFAKAVRRQARLVSEEMCGQVYRTAARWFAENGYLEDAFRHAFASEDFEFAADILEDYLGILYDRDEIAAFRRWLLKLPRDVFTRHPLLRLLECRFKIETVQLSDMAETLEDIEGCRPDMLARYEGAKRQLCDDLLLLFKYILPHWYDPENVDEDKLKDALDRVSLKSRTLAGIGMLIPFRHLYRGEMEAAGKALDETSPIVFSSGRRLDRAIWFRVKAMVERFQGRLSASEAVLEKALPHVRGGGIESGYSLEFMIDLPKAWLCYLRNDLGKAAEYGSTALKYIEQSRFLYELIDGNYLMSIIYLSQRETDKADKCIQRMQWGAMAAGAPELLNLTDAYFARLMLFKGDYATAEKWCFQHRFREEEPFSLRFVVRGLVLSEVVLRGHDYERALHMLEVLRARCSEHNMMEAVLETEILLSLCAFAMKNRRQAKGLMRNALRLAESEGYIRPFVERADIVLPLLSEMTSLSRAGRETPYTMIVSKACSLSLARGPSGRRTQKVGEDLTGREKEILGLMAKGLRDKEIAESLFVSLSTAKTHVRHILEKLDARTRVQAIERAREQKIRFS